MIPHHSFQTAQTHKTSQTPDLMIKEIFYSGASSVSSICARNSLTSFQFLYYFSSYIPVGRCSKANDVELVSKNKVKET